MADQGNGAGSATRLPPPPWDGAGRAASPEAAPVPWGRAVRDVALVAGLLVGGILGLVVLTSLLPAEAQRVVFHTPLAIVLLAAGTTWMLWSITRRSGGR